jgi:predicted  nucleic acid-binding Zn-ribbon protein
MAAFEDLLTLQAHDTAADRLRHRRAALPERITLAEQAAARLDLEAQLAEATARRDEVAREERRLDDEIRSLEAKAKAEEARMYSGTISSPRELQAMQSDVEQLRRHARQLEDQELEVMERREAVEAEVTRLEAARAEVQTEMDRLSAIIAEEEAVIDAELALELEAREALLPGIPESMLGLYEEVRAANRGVGAARLVGPTCQACHLALPATEVDRIRRLPPDAMARCDHCGAILVR